jgi:hypothetical protein
MIRERKYKTDTKIAKLYTLHRKTTNSFGPCAPRTNVFSISAVLLGPVMVEMEEGKESPYFFWMAI